MKVFKKRLTVIVFTLILVCIMPMQAIAAPDDFSFTPSANPAKTAPLGGEIKVSAAIKNEGATNITRIAMQLNTLAGFDSASDASTWHGTLAPGASITLTWDVDFAAGDLSRDLTMTLLADNDADMDYDETQNRTLRVNAEENVFRSGGGAEPEKAVYYVGETVTVTDAMRNSLTIAATDLSLAYYFKTASHGTKNGDPIDLGDVAGGASEEYSFDYTFTEDDIGNFRIGSEITYHVAGRGPYDEFNIAHDFVVESVPTPTPTPEPTPSPTPEPTPEAASTPAPEETDTGGGETESAGVQNDETAAAPTEAAETDGADKTPTSSNWLTIIIIVLAALLFAAVIVLVVVLAKKNKDRDDFG